MTPLTEINYFLLDMDGTLYLGDELIPGAKRLTEEIKTQGKRALYITNNSSKGVNQYVDKLRKLGIDAEPEDFFTSAHALVRYLSNVKSGASLYLMGTPDLEEFVSQGGFKLVKKYGEVIDYVVLGFDTTLTYEKIRIACDYLTDGVEFIATHPDLVCPVEGGRFIPDCGSMLEMFKAATKRTPSVIIGKPNTYIVDMIIEELNCKKTEIAIVGDRLKTDILTAINAGVTSVAVLSGETTLEEIKNSIYKPDYIVSSVYDIYKILKGERNAGFNL
ncbi:MAG: HAD-IIA family hydrolase [Clostridiales bacterium]|jgi:NagD protein|nr:HAD-IIA family hydrolase [Clostridiales bacterium]